MRKRTHILRAICMSLILSLSFLSGCESRKEAEAVSDIEEEDLIVVGFSQVGSESYWRNVNSESMRSVFTKENGYKLIFEDAQQKQTNQIKAIRSFIQQEVDYIVVAPVTEAGWDTVLQEARDEGIPVIIVDRMVDANSDLYTCWVGSDFVLEGRKMCEWIRWFCVKNNIPANDIYIADVQGTIGASAQIGRTQGLAEAAKKYGWTIVAKADGEFTRAKGYEVTQQILKSNPKVNVVYCENDDEAFGAIKAIEDAGKKVGSDIKRGEIMVVSFDGVKPEALQNVVDNSISCIAECNPFHGPRVEAIIRKLESGETPQKFEYVDEDILSSHSEIEMVTVDSKQYPVTKVTQEVIDRRIADFDTGAYADQPDNVY